MKSGEPNSLAQHRATPHSTYDNLSSSAKQELRLSLVSEQGAICCYCMARIRPEPGAMKIEHWQCQRHFEPRQLDYRNLLASCAGGDGHSGSPKHCDTSKEDQALQWNPAERQHAIESRVTYQMNGIISSSDVAFDRQLNTVLNLNLKVIKNGRQRVLLGIKEWWNKKRGRLRGPVPKTAFERRLTKYLGSGPQLPPYCGAAIWWLRRRIAGLR